MDEFLRNNCEIKFSLLEHILASRYSEKALYTFNNIFCKSFTSFYDVFPEICDTRISNESIRQIPAYKNIDWGNIDNWHSIPLTNKKYVRQHFSEYINPYYQIKDVWYRESSGTSGPPLKYWYSSEFYFELQLFSISKVAWLAGVLTNDVLANQVFSCSIVDGKYRYDRVWACPNKSRGLTLQLVYNERDFSSASRIYQLLENNTPSFLSLSPNILQSLLTQKNITWSKLKRNLCLIITSGAMLTDALRKLAENEFEVPVINAYALSEFGLVASECMVRNGMHIYEHEFVTEILHDEKPHTNGCGELVLSSKKNIAMPFLRYKTGDLVQLTSEICKCGKLGRRILNVQGRSINNFKLPDGNEYAPTKFKDLFRIFPINEFRITQVSINKVEVEVEFSELCIDQSIQLEKIRIYVEKCFFGLVHCETKMGNLSSLNKLQRYRTLL